MNGDTAKGKVACHRGGLPFFAEVTLNITASAETDIEVHILCTGRGWICQGNLEEVPPTGYDTWKKGAVYGAKYALAVLNITTATINITRIAGLTTDTNPSIVALAAARAVWTVMDASPPLHATEHLENQTFSSWNHDIDHVPND